MRRLLSALAALGLLAGLAGCEARDPLAGNDWPAPSPALWEVTAPGGEKAWLFGTMHALPEGVEWRTEAIDNAFAEADLLVVEIAELGDEQLAFDAFRERAYSDGLPALYDRVESDERQLVEAMVEKANGDPADYADMESWAAAMVLAGGIRVGDPEFGADRVLMAEGKTLVGLESFEEQYDIFDRLAEEDQDDLLLAMARDAGQNSASVLTEAWLTGDVELYTGHINASLADFPALQRALVIDRNARWARRIAELTRSGRKPFVSVGAAHVPGEHGLVSLLEARGYEVTRLQ